MRSPLPRVLFVSACLFGLSEAAVGQEPVQRQVEELSRRVEQLESRPPMERVIHEQGAKGAIAFLYGVFCALWAQNTGRNPWLWFFLGVIFSLVIVVILLLKNADDRQRG